MSPEDFIHKQVYYMPPVESYDELKQPSVDYEFEYAMAFHCSRSDDTHPYFFIYEKGKWSQQSVLIGVEDMNIKVHRTQAWNKALDAILEYIDTHSEETFTADELRSVINKQLIRV